MGGCVMVGGSFCVWVSEWRGPVAGCLLWDSCRTDICSAMGTSGLLIPAARPCTCPAAGRGLRRPSLIEHGPPSCIPCLTYLQHSALPRTAPHITRQPIPILNLTPHPCPCSRLGNNRLSGTIPEAWGAPGTFPRLRTLGLDNNTLSGTLPAAWGQPAVGCYLQEL